MLEFTRVTIEIGCGKSPSGRRVATGTSRACLEIFSNTSFG